MKSLAVVLLGAVVITGCSAGAVPSAPSGEEPLTSPSRVAARTPVPPSATGTTRPEPSATRTPYASREPAAVLREFDVGEAGWAMTLVDESLWVQVDPPTDAIVRIDVETGQVTPVVPRGWYARSGVEGVWVRGQDFLISVDPATGGELARAEVRGSFALADGSLWVLDGAGLHRVDPDTGAVASTITPKARICDDVKDLTIAFDAMWAACKHGEVHRVELGSGELTQIVTRAGSHTFHVSEEAVWVTNYQSNSTSRIDPSTNAVVTIPSVGGGIGITEGDGLVWVATNSEFVGLDADGDIKRRLAVAHEHFWYDLIWTEQGIWGSTAGPTVYLIDVP